MSHPSPHPSIAEFEFVGEENHLALPFTRYKALGGTALGLMLSSRGGALLDQPQLSPLLAQLAQRFQGYTSYSPKSLTKELTALGLSRIADPFDEASEALLFGGPKLDGMGFLKGYHRAGALLQFLTMNWIREVLRLQPRTPQQPSIRLIAPAQYAALTLPSQQGIIIMERLPSDPLELLLSRAHENHDTALAQRIEAVINHAQNELRRALGELGIALACDTNAQGNNLAAVRPYDPQFAADSSLTIALFDQPPTDTPKRYRQAQHALAALEAGLKP